MNTSSHFIKNIALLLLLFVFITAGCGRENLKSPNSQWKKITVEYCVGSPPDVVMKSWSTEDQKTLDELRNSLKINKKTGLTLITAMKTNRIILTLSDDTEIIMHIFDDDNMSYYYPSDRQQSFAIRPDKMFVEKLKKTIESTTGEPVHFYYDREANISK